MNVIAGVDGCKAGWLSISQDIGQGTIRSSLHADAQSLLECGLSPVMIAIDIPIGLTDRGDRSCDQMARTLLGKRASCVFTAPSRNVLAAETHEEASAIRFRTEGKKVPIQAWSIFRKIRKISEALTPKHQNRVREVHPELCFMAWNDGVPIPYGKKSAQGKEIRGRLVAAAFGGDAYSLVRRQHSRRDVADDDIYDAFAALWTARRIYNGTAKVIPERPPKDSLGLRMEMWF